MGANWVARVGRLRAWWSGGARIWSNGADILGVGRLSSGQGIAQHVHAERREMPAVRRPGHPSVTSPAHFLKNKTVPVSSTCTGPLAPFLSIFFFRSGPTAKPENGQVGGLLPHTHARLPYFQ